MKEIFLKLKRYLNKKNPFLSYLFFILLIDYLFLFFLETVLPGFVAAVFNLNLLLVLIILLWLVLTLVIEKENQINNWFFISAIICLILLVLFSMVFSIYKANLLEYLLYISFAFISGWFLYGYFKKNI